MARLDAERRLLDLHDLPCSPIRGSTSSCGRSENWRISREKALSPSRGNDVGQSQDHVAVALAGPLCLPPDDEISPSGDQSDARARCGLASANVTPPQILSALARMEWLDPAPERCRCTGSALRYPYNLTWRLNLTLSSHALREF
jgi:hypothetical protein